jgi:DNA replication protein DnaC
MPANKQPVCSICNDIGWLRLDVPFGHPRHGQLERCACKGVEDAQRLQRLCGLTAAERHLRLDGIDAVGRPGTAQMLSACIAFRESPAGIITLWGGVGNAKTMALQATVNELVDGKVEAVYMTAFDLISHIRDAFNAKREVISEGAYERLLRFERVRVLAIDELDKVRVTEWALEQITDLVDKRYRLGLDGKAGTMIAMNSNPAEQPEWIASRLLDGRNVVVHNADADIRSALKG